MNLIELQAELRHFTAERDWKSFHTPKNLSTALMVEAAELAEIFQWMTPIESQTAHHDAKSKQRIGEEVADVLLYLLQLADHSQIDIAQAVKDKLVRNAAKYPAKRAIPRAAAACASSSGVHVLLDFENVQPTEAELRAMVPDASQVWVFHGPHQQQIEQRFASFGSSVTAVPISKTGRNALDFHLSFYMGYIASRNQSTAMVVVANDKGYEPMLEHARALGFSVRQLGHVRAAADAVGTSASPAKTAATTKPQAKKVAAKKAPAKKAASQQPTSAKLAPAKKAVAKKAATKKPRPAKKAVAKSTPVAAVKAPSTTTTAPASATSLSTERLQKIVTSLRKMGITRPTKSASLREVLRSLLGGQTSDDAIKLALDKLIAAGVVALGKTNDLTYPGLQTTPAAASHQG